MIRQAASGEYAACAALIRTAFLTVAQSFGITPENAPGFTAFSICEEKLRAQEKQGYQLFVWEENGQLAGFYSLHMVENRGCELCNLSVLPAYRHRGIGEKLLRHAFAVAKDAACSVMYLSMVEENQLLRRWYESFGFVHTGTKKFDFVPFTCGYMEKRL